MATKKPSLDQRIATDTVLRKRVLANAGLRSKLSTSVLRKYAPDLAQKRLMNQRLATPITPGSSTTERDLAHEADAAANVRYGDVEAAQKTGLQEEQQRQRDFRGFYDQYLSQLAAHSEAVKAIGANANAANLAAQQGITGLAGADLAQLQGNANAAAAAQGVTQAGNLQPMASNAAAIRQALTGSFIAQQSGNNAAAQTQASNFANAVGPQQKLAAEAIAQGRVREAGDKIIATAKEKGAFNQQFRADRRADEAKQVLARQTLGANVAKADTAAKAKADADANKLNKYGYTTSEWNKLSEQRKNSIRSKQGKGATGGDPNRIYTSGPFAGKSKAYIDGLTQGQRDKIVSDYNNKGPSQTADQKYIDDFKRKYGIAPITDTKALNKAKGDIKLATRWLDRLKGQMSLDEAGKLLTTGQAKSKDSEAVPRLDAVLIRAAMDQINSKGYISASTADRLHRSGYSVPQLGLKTPKHSTGPNAPIGKPPQKTGY